MKKLILKIALKILEKFCEYLSCREAFKALDKAIKNWDNDK